MDARDLPHPVKYFLALCLWITVHLTCLGQCGSGNTRIYDTLLTSNGFQIYSLTFPQFSPDSGTLISVKLAAQVSSQYGFTLQNQDVSSANYILNIGQEDQFSGSAFSTFTGLTNMYVGAYPLNPNQSITTPPFTFLNNHVTADSITDVTPFLGEGQVNINYMSFTYTNLTSINNASYAYSENISDNMKFSLQYLYCNPVVLATGLTNWTAQLTSPGTVLLTWSAADEPPGREYDIQRSKNGQDFSTISTVSALADNQLASYSFTDLLPAGAGGDVYYRLAIRDATNLTWSPVRVLHLATVQSVLRIYPNPAASYIDLTTGGTFSDWQIDIFTANGGLMQRETRIQSSDLHISLIPNISPGAYFVRATDLHSQETHTLPFVVAGKP